MTSSNCCAFRTDIWINPFSIIVSNLICPPNVDNTKLATANALASSLEGIINSPVLASKSKLGITSFQAW